MQKGALESLSGHGLRFLSKAQEKDAAKKKGNNTVGGSRKFLLRTPAQDKKRTSDTVQELQQN